MFDVGVRISYRAAGPFWIAARVSSRPASRRTTVSATPPVLENCRAVSMRTDDLDCTVSVEPSASLMVTKPSSPVFSVSPSLTTNPGATLRALDSTRPRLAVTTAGAASVRMTPTGIRIDVPTGIRLGFSMVLCFCSTCHSFFLMRKRFASLISVSPSTAR